MPAHHLSIETRLISGEKGELELSFLLWHYYYRKGIHRDGSFKMKKPQSTALAAAVCFSLTNTGTLSSSSLAALSSPNTSLTQATAYVAYT